jgi:AcrR family transcriptional regulator
MPAAPADQAARLNPELFLDAAERVVRAEGLSRLTMRRIGVELGADPTAVYRHFASKEALLTALAGRMFSTEPVVDLGASWRDQLRAVIRHAFERYRAHPDLAMFLARQPDDLPQLVALTDRMLALLIEGAGLDLAQAGLFVHVLEHHAVGSGLFLAIAVPPDDARLVDVAGLRAAYAMLPQETAPHARAAAPYMFSAPGAVFDCTTDLIIDAIERIAGGAGGTGAAPTRGDDEP